MSTDTPTASPRDPESVPDAWRLDGEARVADEAGDYPRVRRYGDRLVLTAKAFRRRIGADVVEIVIPVDCEPSVCGDVRRVISELQAFLRQVGAE